MNFSKIAFCCAAALLLFSGTFFYPRWQKGGQEAQISWDASGYYWYLPSVFIYHDLKGQHFKNDILQKYQPTPPNDFQQGFLDSASGNYVMKYTMGTALMELPFFAIAQIAAKPLGYPPDGFSPPYQFMIYLGGLFFALLGLWYLRKLLLFYYSDKVVAVVLLLLVLGTNYLNYCGIDVGMSHVWLFTLYVFILLNTHFYYQTGKRKYIFRTGALIGLAALTRPPEIIAVLIPLLWGMENVSAASVKKQAAYLWQRRSLFLIAALMGMVVLSLQFIYWKYASGRWFVYGYRDQGFSWLHPHLKIYAFNYQSGWLVYTPLMFLPFVGLIPFLKKGKNKIAIVAMIVLNYYIVTAWDLWDYGGRAMVQSYPLLLFPLAALIQFLGKRKTLLLLASPVILLLVYFNLWWTYQAHGGGLIGGVPNTAAYYWNTVLRYDLPLETQKLRDNKDHFTGAMENKVLLYKNDFDQQGSPVVLNKPGEKSGEFAMPMPVPKPEWIRAEARIGIGPKEWNTWNMTQFVIRFKKEGNTIKENLVRLQRFLNDGETANITMDAKVPAQEFDSVIVFFLNFDDKPCTVHNLKVIGFDAK